jgi:uncharacterized RDD family membrane protein YckC
MSRDGGHHRDQLRAERGFDAPVVDHAGVIITPEAVVIDLDTGGVASRLLAGLIDAVLRVVVLWVILLLSLLFGLGGGTSTVVVVFSVFAALMVYPVLCETLTRGRTPGKRAVGLRVVTVDGAPIRFREAWLRMLGGIADLLLPPGGVTGLLFVWGTPRNQRIGDLLAGTIVVRDARIDGRTGAFWFDPPYGLAAYADSIDPTAMTVDQYTVVRSFLLRVHELADNARYAVAHQLADSLATRLHHVRPQNVAPEAFLLCAVARYQRQHLPMRLAASIVPGSQYTPPPAAPAGPPMFPAA